MKLVAMSLKNFRGYRDTQRINFDDLTTIVGKNDAGKSTILEALAIFFGNELVKADSSDLNVRAEENYFEVTCYFDDLPTSLILDSQAETDLQAEHLLDADNLLQVRKRWICTSSKPKEDVAVVCQHPANDQLNDLLALTNANLKKRVKSLLPEAIAESVNKSSNPAMRRALWDSTNLVFETQEVPLNKEDAGRIWTNISSRLPHFALFQSDRPSKDSDSEVQDPMKLAIASALAEEDVQESLASVVEAVRTRATELAQRTHSALAEIDAGVAGGLVPEFKSDPRWSSLFNVALTSDNGVSINKRGSGVRRLILVSFFKAEATRKLEENSKSSVIYAVEEPETSQHPHNQRILLDSLQKMASTSGCQVILTSHSPGFVSQLPAESLRFVQKSVDGTPAVSCGNEDTWAVLAHELGVQPDNRVRVLICVEGPTDVEALQGLSAALHAEDPAKYAELSSDPRFAFVPQGGGTLSQWVSHRYLRDFRRLEFHIYDGDVEKYQSAAEEVNARGDGSVAVRTRRREIENYLHPAVIQEVIGVEVSFGHQDDVPKVVSDKTKQSDDVQAMGSGRVKKTLAKQAFAKMSAAMIDAVDPDGEVRSWFERLTLLAE